MPDFIDYTRLAQAVNAGYQEDSVLVDGKIPDNLAARHSGLYQLDDGAEWWDTRVLAKADRDVLNFGIRNCTFCIPRDFLVDLLFYRPNVQGLQFIFGSQKVKQFIPIKSRYSEENKPREIDIDSHCLLIAGAHFTTPIRPHQHEAAPPDHSQNHWLIDPFYIVPPTPLSGQMAAITEATPADRQLINGFAQYQRKDTSLEIGSPKSYFVGRMLLVKILLNIVNADSIQQGYNYLKIQFLLENSEKNEPGSNAIGLIMRGVNNIHTDMFSIDELTAGPAYTTRNYGFDGVWKTGSHCTLPCPDFCPKDNPADS